MPKRSRLSWLTAEQQALLTAIRDKWMAIGLSTEPADRLRAEAAVRIAYRRVGLRDPAIVWLNSPLAGAIGVAYINALDDTIQKDLTDRVWERASVKARVEASVRESVGASLWESTGKSVAARVWARVGKDVWARVGRVAQHVEASAWQSVVRSVWESVSARVSARVSASVSEKVWVSVRSVGWNIERVQENVLASMLRPVRLPARVGGNPFTPNAWANVLAAVGIRSHPSYGQHDATWIGWIDAFTQFEFGDVTAPADGLTALCESCGWYWPFRDVVILTERHSRLHRDDRGRLHNPHGMAVQYPDGWGVYTWHGVNVPEEIIMKPITLQQIRDERNAEIRRVLLERYGADRFVIDSGALPVHADECGTLYRVLFANDEPLVLVKLVNSTPEPTRERGLIQAPDGTWRKQYWLRVPPLVGTAREAVAWTFGMEAEDYWPAVET